MLKQVIENKLNELNKEYKQTGDEFFLTTCLSPAHTDKKPSFSINFNTGKGFCFTCGYSINKEYWLNGIIEDEEEIERQIKINKLKAKIKKEETKKVNLILPPKSKDVDFNFRSINKELWKELDCYICNTGRYRNRIVMPIKYNDEVLAFETRALDNNTQPKYLHSKGLDVKSLIYPYNKLKICYKPYIVLVEGILDAISGWQLDIPTMSNFGVAANVNMTKITDLLSIGVETVYVALDKDKVGEKGNKVLLNSLYTEYFNVKSGRELKELRPFYESEAKDLNEYLNIVY